LIQGPLSFEPDGPAENLRGLLRPYANVTLKQLWAFVAVADLGRFNLAASHLRLTQSSVSILVKELEGELKHRLFDRNTRVASLTAAAREFLPQARKILEDLDIAVGQMRDLSALRRGSVSVAAGIVLAATVLPPAVARYVRRYPEISVQIRDMPGEEVLPALRRHEVDLGISTSVGVDAEIESVALGRDRFAVVCRSDHPFAALSAVRWSDLGGQALISLVKENPLRGVVNRVLAVVGAELNTRYEVRYSTTAISMVAEGLGVAILPENSQQLTTAVNVKMILLGDPVVSREIALLHLKQRALSPAAMRLKETLVASIESQAPYADAALF
jgi:LysR family transcriptional regulator, carnitine catabolism transcriptional activator